MVVHVETDKEIMDCFETLKELRPSLQKEGFVDRVRDMYSEGYRLISETKNNDVIAVAGFRILSNFAMGRKLYIEDLVTSEAVRSKGFGKILLDYLESFAKQEGCQVLHLDSGTQRHRAHKFYFTNNLEIFSYHFVKHI
ncbi:MAG: GNAT family N-acetyltransferase [Pseudomonadales bacterium]